MAVLTSGELAIDSAMRLARFAGRRALDPHLDELARAFAVAHHLMGEIEQKLVERARNAPSARISGVGDWRARPAAPVANSSSVSEVDVSLSTVIALNERRTDFDSIAWSAGAAIAASVNTKDSIVAMSGAIMPAPLAMPLIDDLAFADA